MVPGLKEKLTKILLDKNLIKEDDLQKALAAQREKGRIRITVERMFISKEDRSYICTQIADNGTGIDDMIIGKVFEPYFTTKGEKGTGLGLTTVKEIIEASSGWIEIHAEKGQGTTFTIFLPEHIA